MTTLEARETRCKYIRLDGKQCKNKVVGEDKCEHHAFDFYYFMRNPIAVAKRYKRYWGKAHHPACDKKGTLLCDCPNISDGAIMVQALRKACQESTRVTRVAKAINHFEMLEKTRKIRDYYRSISAEDIDLPPDSNRRQFRIFAYDRRAKRVVVKKIKDCIRNSEVLLKHLRRHAPIAVYYSTSTWLNPQQIGPDPFSKSGRRKFRKKGFESHYHNTWMGQGFFIDVDYEMKDSRMAAEMTEKVIAWYRANINAEANLTVVRSGGKGFHVIDFDYDIKEHLENNLPQSRPMLDAWNASYEYTSSEPFKQGKKWIMTPSGMRQNISRTWKKGIIERMKRDGLLVDFEVTPDPRRIIRVPGTVHGKKMTLCEVISEDKIYNESTKIE
tara:strand:+ start:12558 stop:13712 length:1155 start_codon:yes stop_codon:yes gene_type:complete